jgi:hypothetical protein
MMRVKYFHFLEALVIGLRIAQMVFGGIEIVIAIYASLVGCRVLCFGKRTRIGAIFLSPQQVPEDRLTVSTVMTQNSIIPRPLDLPPSYDEATQASQNAG